MSILAVDFDLTICSDSRFGAPMDGAAQKLRWLRARGHRIIVHSAKASTDSGTKAIAAWMKTNSVPYHDIAGKLHADVYLDDKALHFTTWEDAWQALH